MRNGAIVVRPRSAWVLGAVLWAVVAAAQPASGQVVTGSVVDAVSGAPLAAATVTALTDQGEQRLAVVTDTAGRFALPLATGRFSFVVRHIGYEALETDPVTIGRDERIEVEIRLGPRPLEMDPLVVQARRTVPRGTVFQERMDRQQRMGSGRFITRQEIEAMPAAGINELIAMEPGIELVRARTGDVVVLTSRGRRCLPVLYIDGVQVVQRQDDELDLSHLFHPSMVEGIEIYRTPLGAPPELSTNGCGAIAVWSRTDGSGNPFTLRRIATAAGWLTFFVLLLQLL
jgi:hypothetical protein